MHAEAVQPNPIGTGTLDEISHAFFAALDRDGGPVSLIIGSVAAVLLLVLFAWWIRRETRRGRIEQEVRDVRYEVALSEATGLDEKRTCVCVPARVRMTVQHADAHHRFFYEDCRTEDLSGTAVTFLSKTPLVVGLPLHFRLDLGEKWPLPLRGIVARAEPPPVPGAPSLVSVKLGPITARERERVVRWVAREEEREIAQARRGRLCPCCRRPLSDDAGERHSTCAASAEKHPKEAV